MRDRSARYRLWQLLIGPGFHADARVTFVCLFKLVDHIGTVTSVVWMRAMGVLILLALPLVPAFWMAAVLHMLRSALNRGTAGARQALTLSLVRDHRPGQYLEPCDSDSAGHRPGICRTVFQRWLSGNTVLHRS